MNYKIILFTDNLYIYLESGLGHEQWFCVIIWKYKQFLGSVKYKHYWTNSLSLMLLPCGLYETLFLLRNGNLDKGNFSFSFILESKSYFNNISSRMYFISSSNYIWNCTIALSAFWANVLNNGKLNHFIYIKRLQTYEGGGACSPMCFHKWLV